MIIALDPGRTTGWATKSKKGYASGQVQPYEVWGLLTDLCGQEAGDPIEAVILEQFHYRQLPKVDLTPVKVIGIVEEWGRQHPVVPLVPQSPSQRKFFTDDRLKERGLYAKGAPHANDAMRHLLYYGKEFVKGR